MRKAFPKMLKHIRIHQAHALKLHCYFMPEWAAQAEFTQSLSMGCVEMYPLVIEYIAMENHYE